MFKKFYYFITVILTAPIAIYSLICIINFNNQDIGEFLKYSLTTYFSNTIIIIIVASILATIISFYFAYIMSFYTFKFKKIIEVLIVLPLAIPVYIGAYSYGAIFSPTSLFYKITNLKVDIMSLWGLILIYILFLYPYIYLPLRGYLFHFNKSIYENAKLFTQSEFKLITKIIFPLCIPTISIGTTFFLFEIFSDFGASKYFSVETFAQAINQAWFTYNNMSLALIISTIFSMFIFILIMIKQQITLNKKFNTSKGTPNTNLQKLTFKKRIYFILFATILLSLGFFIPFIYMLSSTIKSIFVIQNAEYFSSLINTISITIVISILIIIVSIFISNYASNFKNYQKYINIFLIGYMLPSIMIALFVYQTFILMQDFINIAFTQSILIVIYAYIIRFVSVSNANITNAFLKINSIHIDNSKLFGYSEFKILTKIKLPMINSVLIYTFILVILEVAKELSLMLFLRPFGFETLATKAYTYANDERIMESSIYSLSIVIFCTVAIILMNILKEKNARTSKH